MVRALTTSTAAAAAKSLQSCPTLCDPMDCSLPGFSVHGILQERTLECVAISYSNAWKWNVKVKSLSRVWVLATAWTAAYQAPPSMGFSRQEYWSGVPLPSPTTSTTPTQIPPVTSCWVLNEIWTLSHGIPDWSDSCLPWSQVPFLPAWSPTQRQLLTFCSLPAGTICLILLANPSLELE